MTGFEIQISSVRAIALPTSTALKNRFLHSSFQLSGTQEHFCQLELSSKVLDACDRSLNEHIHILNIETLIFLGNKLSRRAVFHCEKCIPWFANR